MLVIGFGSFVRRRRANHDKSRRSKAPGSDPFAKAELETERNRWILPKGELDTESSIWFGSRRLPSVAVNPLSPAELDTEANRWEAEGEAIGGNAETSSD